MMPWKGIHIADGTDQASRFPYALEPGYFNVDELMFEELLAMGSEVASVINFYNLQNEVSGDWGDLFNADEAVIMSIIMRTDLKRLESDFFKIPSDYPDKRATFILELADKLNFWLVKLNSSQHSTADTLGQKLSIVIDKSLVVELHNIGKILLHSMSNSADSKEQRYSNLISVWCVGTQESDNLFSRSTINDLENKQYLKQQLRSSFYAFSNSISYLQTEIPLLLKDSLSSEQHNPAVGLYIVFLRLYEKAQQKINAFTSRHLEFYYKDILKVKKRKSLPESVYLAFETQAGTSKAVIEKNTEFSAGKDESQIERIFSADEFLRVTDTKIKSLATLYLQHDNLISPECELGYVSGIKSDITALSKESNDSEDARSWPIFGAKKSRGNISSSEEAAIGFSLASPLLLLKEGKRKIELAIKFDSDINVEVAKSLLLLSSSDSEKTFTSAFGKIFSIYMLSYKGCLTKSQKELIIKKASFLVSKYRVEEIISLLKQDWQGLFYRLFKDMFCIKMTTKNGWLSLDNYIVEPYTDNVSKKKLGIKVICNLGYEVESVEGYSASVHGGELQTDLPICEFKINPKTNFYPYSVFQEYSVSSLNLNVEVKGIKNILLYNHYGQLDHTKPFQPFGPLPTSNGYFILGNYEISRKPLDNLKLNIEWGGLPKCNGGFYEYYRGYETDFDNFSFKAEQTTLSDNHWYPLDKTLREEFNLFDSSGYKNGRLPVKNIINLSDFSYSKPVEQAMSEEDFKYGIKSRDGFFRISLKSSEAAFGHAEYPQLLTKVLSSNAKTKKHNKPPNTPYTPVINKVSLEYKASSKIKMSAKSAERNTLLEKIFNIHPFGFETVYPALIDKPCYLFPKYDEEGYLFIGISAKEIGGVLTLFFHLSEESGKETNSIGVSVEWSYLSSNTWKAIPAKNILSDTTNGFLSPGIVTLNMPDDMTCNDSVMPGKYFWLRCSVEKDASTFGSVYSVLPHALKVSRKNNKNNSIEKLTLDVKWNPVLPLSGVAKLVQVGNSFGGRDNEDDIKLKTRISERLRHKDRASVPWDYERLILEKFPDLYKVKCFSNFSSMNNKFKPGQVLIVVVPYPNPNLSKICIREMVNPERLRQIKEHVKKRTSPFAKIEVRNPVYEQVQVRCTVKFVGGINTGSNIKKLNQDISDFICPWEKIGYKAKFGWSVRKNEVEAYIRSLNYVDFITNFSMLHITVDKSEKYSLFDTANKDKDKDDEVVIRPYYPWSLAVPAKNHFIETTQITKSIKEQVTGIDKLELGSNFIISGKSKK